MLKKIILLFLIVAALSLSFGCDVRYQYKEEEDIINSKNPPSCLGTYEWISEDGVHYFVISSSNGYGIVPRYDNDGNLVIDKGE